MKTPIKRSKSKLLSSRAEAALIAGARDFQRVSGLTHNFYRYPARFSPSFVRAAIKAFSRQGDLVLDPYVGGGTTMVEAAALGPQHEEWMSAGFRLMLRTAASHEAG